MFDIPEQLFPNILTILVQLSATGVIVFLYMKFLHQPVLRILDKKAEDFQKEYNEVEHLKKEQAEAQLAFEVAKKHQNDSLEQARKQMQADMEKTKSKLMSEAEDELVRMKQEALREIEDERKEMVDSVERHVLELATSMVEKVLEGYHFEEDQMIHALEKEMDKIRARS